MAPLNFPSLDSFRISKTKDEQQEQITESDEDAIATTVNKIMHSAARHALEEHTNNKAGYLNLINQHQHQHQHQHHPLEDNQLPCNNTIDAIARTVNKIMHPGAVLHHALEEHTNNKAGCLNLVTNQHQHQRLEDNQLPYNNTIQDGHVMHHIGKSHTMDDASSHNSSPKPEEGTVSITETVRSIVNDDQSWFQIRRQMKDARVVTSMGVCEVCAEYINEKSEKIRKEKIKEAKRMESLKYSNLSKLRKRLSIFG